MPRYFDWLDAEGLALYETELTDPLSDLFPDERIGLERAVPKRVREFTAGRHCARLCLRELGFAPGAILSGPDRLPVWPEGVTGSITHTDDHCAVVVGRISSRVGAIGIDLEPEGDLPADILEMVARPEECIWLQEQPAGRRGLLAKVIFSAKECAYKAQYPLSHTMLEFHDFRLRLNSNEDGFEAEFMCDCAPFTEGQRLSGQLRIANGGIACAIIIPGREYA